MADGRDIHLHQNHVSDDDLLHSFQDVVEVNSFIAEDPDVCWFWLQQILDCLRVADNGDQLILFFAELD